MFEDYETFEPKELASCLRHYDLGEVTSIKPFRRGSRRSPKAIIEATGGKFLFKRRARGRDDPSKVAFAHQIQLHLAASEFPLPKLILSAHDQRSMLIHNSQIYELFQYIEGDTYDGSLEATMDSGRRLGQYHRLLRNFQSDHQPPTGTYHDAPLVETAIRNTMSSLPLTARPPANVLRRTVDTLEEMYTRCADEANDLGLREWDSQIVHGDWHPGNIMFAKGQVVAVMDYDAARVQQRSQDIANGALQFSILGGGQDPAKWPGFLDRTRFRRFMMGYRSAVPITADEVRVIPFLMCEAMIAEAVLPIAATGTFGRLQGFVFLEMVERKVDWILANLDMLAELLAD